ncbi:MAG: hypothetical protein EA368_13055 [Leptolyngbya sp. DLM2.Bin27]|nr:MAG: hypothetical protein EA368_13055 [Leptolyngbya sp. DLM2.Bin27]
MCSSLLATPGHRALAQTISTATITEIVDSNQVYIQNRVARVNSVARQRQQVQTRAARASLRFNTGAVARLAHNSSLVVGQCAQINRGTLLVNGSLNGCSTSTVAGVRGTIYTIKVTDTGETIIQVFEGEVVVERHLNPETVTPLGEDFDPIDPTQDPTRPVFDPMASFVNPLKPPIQPGAPQLESKLGLQLARPNPEAEPQAEPQAEPEREVGAEPEREVGVDPERETVDFTLEDEIVLLPGQQLIVNGDMEQAVLANLDPEDFIRLLEGPLIRGFAVEIPGIANLRRSFQQLFPSVPLPTFWVPSLPRPRILFPFLF